MIWLAVTLFIIGLGLVVVEVLVPSMGLFTIASALCLIGSVVIAFGQGPTKGFVFLASALVLVPVAIVTALKVLPHTPLGRRLLLGAPDTPQAVASIYEDNTRLLGRQGTAVTTLRPAGTAEFEGERFSVVTEGDLIRPGRQVEVISVEGNRIVVRPLGPDPDEE